MVVAPVSVVNLNGDPVDGLGAEQFHLFDNSTGLGLRVPCWPWANRQLFISPLKVNLQQGCARLIRSVEPVTYAIHASWQ